jgi:hypothetical protein
MHSADFAKLQKVETRLRDLHTSLCRQKIEILNSSGVIDEVRLSSPIDVGRIAELNEKISCIEAMQEEVYRKWQQPIDAEVELELDKLKRGGGNSDQVYGTGERGGNYEVRISRKGSVYKRYI